jgi:hypothetical protein
LWFNKDNNKKGWQKILCSATVFGVIFLSERRTRKISGQRRTGGPSAERDIILKLNFVIIQSETIIPLIFDNSRNNFQIAVSILLFFRIERCLSCSGIGKQLLISSS